MRTTNDIPTMRIGEVEFVISRPHRFGLVILGMLDDTSSQNPDYLHNILLQAPNRNAFFDLVDCEGLVVCKNVRTASSTYRKVRGKSSMGRLSQAEYYHHDGCSSPEKPRINEIRLPHQSVDRKVATAIAPFRDVVRAQVQALPQRMLLDDFVSECRAAFACNERMPPADEWDRIQGHITRLVRRDMDAESARAYFREVDQLAGAYNVPWEMGESRFMLNHHSDLTCTMQHRRAFQQPKLANDQNGRLVKRWTAEESEPIVRR